MPLPGVVDAFRVWPYVLAPDVGAIPYCQVACDGSVSDDGTPAFAAEMRRVAEKYAARFRWTAEGRTGSAHRHYREQRRRPERTRGLPAARSFVPGDGGLGGGRPSVSRVLLPYYLRGRIPHEGLFIRPEDCYERLDARTVFGEAVERVDAEQREVVLRRRPRNRLRPPARGYRVAPRRSTHRGAGGARRAGVLDPGRCGAAGPRPAPGVGSWSSAPGSSRCRPRGRRTGEAPPSPSSSSRAVSCRACS